MILRNLLPQRTDSATAKPESLESLIATAEAYGVVKMYGIQAEGKYPGGYWVKVEFDTVTGTSLCAESDYRLPLAVALRQAIDRAEVIRKQFK